MGSAFVDTAAHLGNDLLDDVQQVRIVLEADRRLGELAVALDEYLVMPVHEDIGDGRFLEQRLERPQTQDFVQNFFDDLGLLGRGHRHALFFQ